MRAMAARSSAAGARPIEPSHTPTRPMRSRSCCALSWGMALMAPHSLTRFRRAYPVAPHGKQGGPRMGGRGQSAPRALGLGRRLLTGLAALLDDEVVGVSLNNRLQLLILVPGQQDEAAGIAVNAVVLAGGEAEQVRAVLVSALTQELRG